MVACAGTVRGGRFELHSLDPEVETPVYFLDPRRKLGTTVNLSGKAIAMMTIANRTGRVEPGATIAFPGRSTPRGPITVRLEPCGTARARLVDLEGTPLAKAVLRNVRITMVVTPGPTGSREPGRAGLLVADESELSEVDSTNYKDPLALDADGRLELPCLIPGASYRFIEYIKDPGRRSPGPQRVHRQAWRDSGPGRNRVWKAGGIRAGSHLGVGTASMCPCEVGDGGALNPSTSSIPPISISAASAPAAIPGSPCSDRDTSAWMRSPATTLSAAGGRRPPAFHTPGEPAVGCRRESLPRTAQHFDSE